MILSIVFTIVFTCLRQGFYVTKDDLELLPLLHLLLCVEIITVPPPCPVYVVLGIEALHRLPGTLLTELYSLGLLF